MNFHFGYASSVFTQNFIGASRLLFSFEFNELSAVSELKVMSVVICV